MTAPVRVPAEVNFKVTGVDQVRNGLRLVGSEGTANLQKLGGASRQLAGGVETIARTGKIAGEGMKAILQQGAEIAFTFGAAGPIVGALAITGLAIYEHITQKMNEATEATNKTRSALEELARGDLMGSATRQQSLFSGDRNAIQKVGESSTDFLARRYGVEGVNKRIGTVVDQMAAKYPNFDRTKGVADAQAFALGGTPTGYRPGKEMTELIQLFKILSTMGPEFQAVSRITENLARAQGSRDKTGLSLAQQQAAVDDARDAREALISRINPSAWLSGIDAADSKKKYQGLLSGLGVQTTGYYGQATTGIDGHAIAAQITPQFKSVQSELALSFEENVQVPMENAIREGMASTIGSAITDGIQAGFDAGSITAGFAEAGKVILAGIGGIFTQMGESLISYGVSMVSLSGALWNPFTSGPAAIAAGAALVALGSSLGAIAHHQASGSGGGGSSVSSSTPPQIIDRGLIDPTRALIATASGMVARSAVNVTVIGPNDPLAQKQIQELVRNANRRGSIG